jgi:hypothetical protein
MPSSAGRGLDLVPGVHIIGQAFLRDTLPRGLRAALIKINKPFGVAQ